MKENEHVDLLPKVESANKQNRFGNLEKIVALIKKTQSQSPKVYLGRLIELLADTHNGLKELCEKAMLFKLKVLYEQQEVAKLALDSQLLPNFSNEISEWLLTWMITSLPFSILIKPVLDLQLSVDTFVNQNVDVEIKVIVGD